jgi:hypothetical protein
VEGNVDKAQPLATAASLLEMTFFFLRAAEVGARNINE